jgi:hypothetical protein
MGHRGDIVALVAAAAPKLAATTPTGAAVVGGLAYAAIQLSGGTPV